MPGLTLEDLEGERWDEPSYHSSLVTTCHQLRKKPVTEFTLSDLRIMINQSIGLPHLMPRAIAALETDPLAEAYFYPGDLLSAVLQAGRSFLRQSPQLFQRLARVVQRAARMLHRAAEESDNVAECHLLREIQEFLQSEGLA